MQHIVLHFLSSNMKFILFAITAIACLLLTNPQKAEGRNALWAQPSRTCTVLLLDRFHFISTIGITLVQYFSCQI
jgi:hypothetical protein